jgi:hypothetical protein
LRAVAYGSGVFIAYTNDTGSTFVSSTDGITWTQRTFNFGGDYRNTFVYGG